MTAQQQLVAARPPAARPPAAPPRRRRHRIRRVMRSRVFRVIAAVLLVLLIWTSWSIGQALTAPGTDSAASRLAEWARDHRLGWVVTDLERIQYWLNPPMTGGTPAGGIPSMNDPAARPGGGTAPTTPHAAVQVHAHLPAPAVVRVIAGAPLANEGRWQTVGEVAGLPAVRVAYVRPDNVHTSYLVGVMWLDPKLLIARLHPGTTDPGGTWPEPSLIPPQWRATAMAGINSGFRLGDASRGGYYAHGRLVSPLRDHAASVVVYKNGTATVGAWGRDVTLGPQVVAVRQNLDLLIDGGGLNPTCATDSASEWGATLGNIAYVARSGLGITKTGALIYVGGPAMSVCTLGQVMLAAGVTRGMELDINPGWIRGAYYAHDGATVTPHRLIDFSDVEPPPPPDRLFNISTRDFFAFYARQ